MTTESLPAMPGGPQWQAPNFSQPEPPGVRADPTPLEAALKHKWAIAGFAAAGALAMLGGLSFVTPRYDATAQVRIDIQQPRISSEGASVLPEQPPTAEAVNTEMAALSSPALATQAAVAMNLQSLREFQTCPQPSRLAFIVDLLDRLRGQAPPKLPPCVASPEQAGRALLGAMSFSADRGSFVIDITASAPDPALAARIANGYAASYVTWQRDQKVKLAQDTDEYLSGQLHDLHEQMVRADQAVDSYRQQHHLIGLHASQAGALPETLRTSQLAQASQALGEIDAELAGRGAAPAAPSPMLLSLQQHHADLSSKLAELRARYGADYPEVMAADAELERNDSLMRAEQHRTARSAQADYAALVARRAAAAARLAALEGDVAHESHDDVGLDELQREAATDRSVYESSFVRLKQLDAERFLERANAALVVEALPPDIAEFPRKRMMAVGAFLACLGLGVGLAFLSEMMSRSFRDAAQIEDEIGLPVIGIFARRRQAPQAIPVDFPHSVEAETIHAVLTQLMGGRSGRRTPGCLTALMTSSLPGEGKSSFTVALGRAASTIGLSAFVLDCDVRRPAVRRLVEGADVPARRDLRRLDISGDRDEVAATLMREAHTDPRSAMRYLSLCDYVGNPRALLTWPGLPLLLAHLRTRYDIVLLDAPPVLAVSDALHLGPLADRVLMMIDWQETPRDAVASAARALSRAGIVVTGAVMSKVDMRRYAKADTKRGLYVAPITAYLEQAV